MTGIIIITYNQPALLYYQSKCLTKFCSDRYHVHVYDTSSNQDIADSLRVQCADLGFIYHRHEQTMAGMQGSSRSHADAANTAWKELCNKYDYFLFMDHDIFPVKHFSVRQEMEKYFIGGLAQVKTNPQNGGPVKYLWPGLLMFNRKVMNPVHTTLIDFDTDEAMGLDTGGNLYKFINSLPPELILYLTEKHIKNAKFTHGFYTFYSMMWDNKFMHFINGSNWAKAEGNALRIQTLLDILNKKIK